MGVFFDRFCGGRSTARAPLYPQPKSNANRKGRVSLILNLTVKIVKRMRQAGHMLSNDSLCRTKARTAIIGRFAGENVSNAPAAKLDFCWKSQISKFLTNFVRIKFGASENATKVEEGRWLKYAKELT